MFSFQFDSFYPEGANFLQGGLPLDLDLSSFFYDVPQVFRLLQTGAIRLQPPDLMLRGLEPLGCSLTTGLREETDPNCSECRTEIDSTPIFPLFAQL